MPTAIAKRLCPHGIFLPVRMARYQEVSRQIRKILESFTPLVQPISLDEAFLDVRGCTRLFGTAVEIGRKIKQRIREEVKLTASVGIAPNKFLAKLASDLDKPDGFVVIPDERKQEILDPLPVSKLWGVGATTEKELHRLGIETIGQLRKFPVEILKERFGSFGEVLYNLSRGIAESEVVPDGKAKSISSEVTFATDIADREELESVLLELSEETAFRLREANLACRTITVKIRLPDFTTLTRSHTLPSPTNLTMEIFQCARELLGRNIRLGSQPIRLLGVGASNLTLGRSLQLDLFEAKKLKKLARLDRTIDEIRKRLGSDSIKRGRSL